MSSLRGADRLLTSVTRQPEIVAVALSPSLDRTLIVETLTPGRIHRPATAVEVAGGKGLNVARALHHQHADVLAVAVLGGATGIAIKSLADTCGLALTSVRGTGNTRTCTSIFSSESGELTEFYEPPTPISSSEWDTVCAEVVRHLHRGGWVTLSGRLPASVPADSFTAFLAEIHVRGGRLALDVHGVALAAALTRQPSVVKINLVEAREALPALNGADAGVLCCAIGELTGGIGIVTDGERGAWGRAPHGPVIHAVSPDRGRYPVGSGDCFMAGVVHSLSTRSTLADAMRLGTALAVANTHMPGPANFGQAGLLQIQEHVAINNIGKL